MISDISESISDIQSVTTKRKTSFAGDVLKLVSGTTIAQVIGILVTPLLTRLYVPEAFGVLALFTSITSILGVIACMRYELAIMLPENDEEAANLLGISLGFTLLLSLLTVPILIWGHSPLLRLLNAPELSPYLWLVPPMVLVSGIFLALNYWNSRTKQFGRLSFVRVISSMVTHLTKLGAGYGGYTTGGSLVSATVAGQVIATVVCGGQIWRDDKRLFLRSIRWRQMQSGLERYRKFPLYSTWSALLNSISWQLPVFLLSTFFSSAVVGYYALGFRILQIPMSLIGGSIAQVFFQRAAEAKAHGVLVDVVENAFLWLVRVSLFPMFILTIIGRDLYTVVFGVNWAEAGVYTQILSIWAFFWFTSSPLSTLFSVLEKQEFDLKINLVLIATRFLALAIGGFVADARLSLLLFAISGIFVYGYQTWLVTFTCGLARHHAIRIYLSEFFAVLPCGIILVLIYVFNMNIWIKALVVIIFSLWHLRRTIKALSLTISSLPKGST